MSGRIHRQMRKQAAEVTQEHAKMVVPALKAAWENSKAALDNDKIHIERLDRIEGVLGRGFWGRVNWLLRGR